MIDYIGPERQLKGAPPPTTEELINQLLDRAFLIAEDFRYTHSKESLISLIQIIVNLNKLGYDFIWDRRRHIVGAHKKSAPTSTRNTSTVVQLTQKALGTSESN